MGWRPPAGIRRSLAIPEPGSAWRAAPPTCHTWPRPSRSVAAAVQRRHRRRNREGAGRVAARADRRSATARRPGSLPQGADAVLEWPLRHLRALDSIVPACLTREAVARCHGSRAAGRAQRAAPRGASRYRVRPRVPLRSRTMEEYSCPRSCRRASAAYWAWMCRGASRGCVRITGRTCDGTVSTSGSHRGFGKSRVVGRAGACRSDTGRGEAHLYVDHVA